MTYPKLIKYIKVSEWETQKEALLAEGWRPVCSNALMTSVPTIMLEKIEDGGIKHVNQKVE